MFRITIIQLLSISLFHIVNQHSCGDIMHKRIFMITSLLIFLILLASCTKYVVNDSLVLVNQTIEAGSEDIDWSLEVIGDTTSIISITEIEDNIDYYTPGEYTINVLVAYDEDNEIELDATITVIDTTKPTFLVEDTTIEAGTKDIDWTTQVSGLSDNSSSVFVVEEVDSVDYDTPGEYEVVVLVSDESENIAYEVITVTVIDTIAPTFDIDNQVIETGAYSSLESFIINIVENSDDELVYSEVDSIIDYDSQGVYTVEVALADNSGNQSSQEVTITIMDPILYTLTQESFNITALDEETYTSLYSEYNVSFDSVYTLSNDENICGTIFKVNNRTELNDLFAQLEDESYYRNEIIFVYLIEDYILMINHPTDSTFPQLLEQFNFEYNYQYGYFYHEDVVHPFVEYLMTSSDHFEDSTGHLIDPDSGAYYGTSIFLRDLSFLSNEWYDGYVIELDNIEDAMDIYEIETNNLPAYGCCTTTIIQYQNIVLRITAQRYYEYLIFDSLPGEIEYIAFNPVIFD